MSVLLLLLAVVASPPLAAAQEDGFLTYNWNNTFPPCIGNATDLEYQNGELSINRNFMKCVQNIPDSMGLPVLRDGQLIGRMLVNSSIQLNNLHSVDPLSGTITVDFYWRVFWHDKRFFMPVFWEKVDEYLRVRGLDLSPLKDFDTGSLIWLPDLRFHDATDVNVLVEGIRVNQDGRIFWSRHVVATFKQPKIDVTEYPSDHQFLHLRYGSYVYDQYIFRSGFLDGVSPISLNSNFDGSFSFKQHSLWSYDAAGSSYGFYTSSSGYHNTVYHIRLERQGEGIILRLILPMTLLILLGGVTFWAEPETRVDSITTLILAVSALYIVILGNIPLVGYLTDFDRFVFWMFLLLVALAIVHQLYTTLSRKQAMWPLRAIYLRLMQATGRVVVFPIVILMYLYFIQGGDHAQYAEVWKAGAAAVVLVMLSFEVPAIVHEIKKALRQLSEKLANSETSFKHLSKFEILVVNYVRYKVISTDFERISSDLKVKRRLSLTKSRQIKLTDTATIRNRQHYNVAEQLEDLTQHVMHTVPKIRRVSRQASRDSDDEEVWAEEKDGAAAVLTARSFDDETNL